jgi:hypothetical protein
MTLIILKCRLFISLIARLLFVQSDVFCALCICSGVAKGYRCEDQALEMNRKVEKKRLLAEKYCSDCEEKLCTECAGWHLRHKVFRSHHVIDLPSVGSRIPPSSKICVYFTVYFRRWWYSWSHRRQINYMMRSKYLMPQMPSSAFCA